MSQALDFLISRAGLLLQEKAQAGETFDIVLNGYSARKIGAQRTPYLRIQLRDVNWNFMQLIYDIDVPYQAALL